MKLFGNKGVYLDYASATPVLREVKKEMDKYWSEDFYNPSAIYDNGVRMKSILEECRGRVARTIGAAKKNIIFTSGATESDNLAIFGTMDAFKEKYPHKNGHMIISSIEHPGVREAARELVERGIKVSVAPVNEEGLVSPEEVLKLVRKDTFLVSIGLANSEIGTIQPIAKIGRLLREKRKADDTSYPYLHTDASQAVNYLSVNLETLNVDLLTLDGSKIYGPKGAGALAVRSDVLLRPITWGGGQESGLRPGTENLPLIVGLSTALEIVQNDKSKESARQNDLRNYFIEEVRKNIPQAVINGSKDSALPNIISLSVPGTLSEMLLLALDREKIMVSVGSACSSSSEETGSYVIRALGKEDLAESTLRFSIGRRTNKDDIDRAISILYRIAS